MLRCWAFTPSASLSVSTTAKTCFAMLVFALLLKIILPALLLASPISVPFDNVTQSEFQSRQFVPVNELSDIGWMNSDPAYEHRQHAMLEKAVKNVNCTHLLIQFDQIPDGSSDCRLEFSDPTSLSQNHGTISVGVSRLSEFNGADNSDWHSGRNLPQCLGDLKIPARGISATQTTLGSMACQPALSFVLSISSTDVTDGVNIWELLCDGLRVSYDY